MVEDEYSSGNPSYCVNPVTLLGMPVVSYIPWPFILIFWSFLFKIVIVVPAAAYTLFYRFLHKNGYSMSGLNSRVRLKQAGGVLKNTPPYLKW